MIQKDLGCNQCSLAGTHLIQKQNRMYIITKRTAFSAVLFFALPFGIGDVTREQSLIFLHKKRGLL